MSTPRKKSDLGENIKRQRRKSLASIERIVKKSEEDTKKMKDWARRVVKKSQEDIEKAKEKGRGLAKRARK